MQETIMLVQDYIQELIVDTVDEPRLTEGNMEDEEDEDTISLCDLAISSEPQSSSTLLSLTSSKESDCFEFFSEELNKNSFSDHNHHLPENVIFCGKLIPSRKPIAENSQNCAPQKQKKWYYNFQCIVSLPFYRRKISSRKGGSGSYFMKEEENKVTDCVTGNDCSVTSDKMSIIHLASSSSLSGRRSRWYLYLFGILKPPTKMDLSNLRNRRSLHQINSAISCSSSISSTSSSFQLRNSDACNEERKFWWVIKALSCGGSHHAQAMVNASIGCFSTTKM